MGYLARFGEKVFEVFKEPRFAGQSRPYLGRWVGVVTEDGMGYCACYHDMEKKKQEYRNFGSRNQCMSWIQTRWKEQGGEQE
jgi:hypothetical protein